MSRKKEILRHYSPRISNERENYDVLDWASAASQRARFAILADNVDLSGRSLLDVGCGLGDLYAFLRRRGIDVKYTGVDIIDGMVNSARRQCPDATFLCADVFDRDQDKNQHEHQKPFPPGSFDVTFCSGTLNLNLGNNMDFLPGALARLVELARETAVFNLLHARSREKEDRYFHYDPDEVMKIVESLPCRAKMIDDYLPNDFTVICRKDQPLH